MVTLFFTGISLYGIVNMNSHCRKYLPVYDPKLSIFVLELVVRFL